MKLYRYLMAAVLMAAVLQGCRTRVDPYYPRDHQRPGGNQGNGQPSQPEDPQKDPELKENTTWQISYEGRKIVDGAYTEEIRVNNIVMKNIQREAIILTLFYSRVPEEPLSERTPIFRNIHIANMTGSQVRSVGSIMGISEMPVSNVSISNVNIDAETGMRVQDARCLTFSDFTVSTRRGPALDIENSEELYLSNVRTYQPSAEVPVMMLRNVRDAMITGCFPMPGSKALAEISGENTAGIVVSGNYVERLSTPFIIGEEVPSDAIVK